MSSGTERRLRGVAYSWTWPRRDTAPRPKRNRSFRSESAADPRSRRTVRIRPHPAHQGLCLSSRTRPALAVPVSSGPEKVSPLVSFVVCIHTLPVGNFRANGGREPCIGKLNVRAESNGYLGERPLIRHAFDLFLCRHSRTAAFCNGWLTSLSADRRNPSGPATARCSEPRRRTRSPTYGPWRAMPIGGLSVRMTTHVTACADEADSAITTHAAVAARCAVRGVTRVRTVGLRVPRETYEDATGTTGPVPVDRARHARRQAVPPSVMRGGGARPSSPAPARRPVSDRVTVLHHAVAAARRTALPVPPTET